MTYGTIELETRVCEGGCGIEFRVMPNSHLRRARKDCAQQCKGVKLTATEKRVVQKVKFAGQPIHARPDYAEAELAREARIATANFHTPPAREKLWLECVTMAKQHMAAVANARNEIIKLAVKCCDIHWGGGDHWDDHQGVYTLRQFAMEIGMNVKTLQNWVRIYRVFNEALPAGEYQEADYKYAAEAYKNLPPGKKNDKAAIRKEFQRQKYSDNAVFRVNMMSRWARTQVNYLKRAKLTGVTHRECSDLAILLAQMQALLKIQTPKESENVGSTENSASMC